MAEHRRFADLNHGHAGLLTYIPSQHPEDEPGLLHTTRFTSELPEFNIIGSSAELYGSSKTSTSTASSALWQERQVQKRWLLQSHPEALMGNGIVSDFLKEDMDRFEMSEGHATDGPLLSIGQMSDVRDLSNVKSLGLLAMATGASGEQLRLARIEESLWQWDDHDDAMLNLSIINPIHKEEEAIWSGDGLPISRIRFATSFWEHGSIRWLLVQTQSSTTILQPEYHPVPVPDDRGPGNLMPRPPSYINPNPLITLQHHQTSGNAHADVCFNPPSLGSPPQIAVVDECGYWTVWSVLGTWQVSKKTLRLSLYKCGHISEGVLGTVPGNPAHRAERHGMLHVGKAGLDPPANVSMKREQDMKTTPGPSKYMLIWNTQRLEVLDLESDTVLPRTEILSQTASRPDWILDVQSSPTNENHVFVLTARQIIWLDLFGTPRNGQMGSRPEILQACPHAGLRNEHCRMSVCRAADNDSCTSLVFVYSALSDQVAVYWFTSDSDTNLPQWHRFITSLSGVDGSILPGKIQQLRVHAARIEESPKAAETGPGADYVQSGTRFYQVNILGEDLSVRYCICATSTNASPEIALPSSRAGWSKSEEKRRWKKKRRQFMRHLGDTFVLPDGMTDSHMESLLRTHDSGGPDKAQADRSEKAVHRPVLLKFDRIAQAINSLLQESLTSETKGLPTALIAAVQEVAEIGVSDGRLPLMSWLEISNSLESPVAYESPDNGMEDDIERLLDSAGDNVIVPQLRRRSPTEPPSSLLGLPYLRETFSNLWLQPAGDSLPAETQRVRQHWVDEISRDFFLSSYGIMVQDIPFFGATSTDNVDTFEDSQMADSTPHSSQRSPRVPSASPAPSSPGRDAPDAAFQRLQLLAPTITPGTLGSLKPCKVLSFWPTERGVGVEDYVSSVAIATDEKFSHAKQRLQRIEAKRKAQSEKYKRPAFMRQGFPASDGPGEDTPIVDARRPPPMQIMSSQQGIPSSSQAFGPSVTMSQPVAGAFGDRKKVKKPKRKSGFR